MGCNHEIAEYVGLYDRFSYCKLCDKKESEIQAEAALVTNKNYRNVVEEAISAVYRDLIVTGVGKIYLDHGQPQPSGLALWTSNQDGAESLFGVNRAEYPYRFTEAYSPKNRLCHMP